MLVGTEVKSSWEGNGANKAERQEQFVQAAAISVEVRIKEVGIDPEMRNKWWLVCACGGVEKEGPGETWEGRSDGGMSERCGGKKESAE